MFFNLHTDIQYYLITNSLDLYVYGTGRGVSQWKNKTLTNLTNNYAIVINN